MPPTELNAHSVIIGLLIVTVFILIADKFRCARNATNGADAKVIISRQYDCNDGAGGSATVKVVKKVKADDLPDPEPNLDDAHRACIGDNVEYFETCQPASDETAKALDCACDPSTGFPFAQNAYGAPGLDYNTFVMSQGVDSQVVANHAEFVKDRQNINAQGGEFTGRTWTPHGEIEGGSYGSRWWGIRGPPMAVPVANPTMQNELDPDNYRYKRVCF